MSTVDPKELESAIARLRRSLADDIAGHAVATPEGNLLVCNSEFARIIGANSIAEAMRINLHELEPQPGAFVALLRRLKDAPLIALEELSFVRRDGTPSQVMARLTATRDDDGRMVEIRVYLVDISERYREELKLRAWAERLHLAELATQDVLWDWDVPNARIHWNDAAVRRFRYNPEEVRATLDWHVERIHPDDRERVLRGMERSIFGIDSSWTDEYRVLRGDDTWATVMDRAHVVRNNRGEAVRVVGSILDITELRASEASQRFLAGASVALEAALDVRESAATLARLCVPDLADFSLVDLLAEDGSLRRVAVANGLSLHDAMFGIDMVFSPDSESLSAPVAVSRTGEVECEAGSGPVDLGRRIGVDQEIDVRGFVTIPIVSRNRPLGTVTLGFTRPRRCLDLLQLMTAKNLASRAGQALNNALLYELAQSAIRSRNEVLAVVSHDLRVPVNTILATLSVLSDSVPERRADVRRWLSIMHRAASQIGHLIDDLLDVSRLESRQFKVDRGVADVQSLIAEACETLRPMADSREITISSELDPDLPRVDADAPRIVRVIGNLISNAIKFSPRGATITVRATTADDGLRISVHDEGPGISPEQQERVFDRFWQGRANDRRGSGLGLSIARGIVEAHGGRIWVESQVDQGSTFTFTLPVWHGDRESGPADGTAAPLIRGSITDGRQAPGPAVDLPWRARPGRAHGATA